MAEKAGMKGPVARTLLLVLHSGSAGGVTLQPECVEGLLSYVRLFFAQPRSGKLSTLAAAGRKVHTVTSWDPGQQSVEAIVQGLADWKAVEGDVGFNIKHTLMEVAQFLYKTTGSSVADMNSANKPNPMYGWEASAMLRSRLLVILPQDSLLNFRLPILLYPGPSSASAPLLVWAALRMWHCFLIHICGP